MKNKINGFAVSSILYPAFIIIITLIVLTLLVLLQSSFSIDKLANEISGYISDNNTMKSMKDSVTNALLETKGTNNFYSVSNGKITYGNGTEFVLTKGENTTNWLGKFYERTDGTQLAYINNGTYCAYKLAEMSGVAVYNTGECANKIGEETGCSDIVNLINNESAIATMQQQIADLQKVNSDKITKINQLQQTVADLQTQVTTLNSNNTASADFLKSHPVGAIYITNNGTNPGSIYGGSWSAYAQGRVLIGVGGTNDTNGTVMSFSAGQYSGEFTHHLTVSEMPSHTHYLNGYAFAWGITFPNNVYIPNNAIAGSTPWNYLSTSQDNFNWTKPNGGDQYHNNVEPYVAVYIWLRTA